MKAGKTLLATKISFLDILSFSRALPILRSEKQNCRKVSIFKGVFSKKYFDI